MSAPTFIAAEKRLLTAEEMTRLAPYEERFRAAIDSDYGRALGPAVVVLFNDTLRASGRQPIRQAGICSKCTLDLLKKIGGLYFETKRVRFS